MPALRLVRSLHEDPIFAVVAGKRRHIPDPGTFEYHDFRRRDVEMLAEHELQALPLGPPLRSRANEFRQSRRAPSSLQPASARPAPLAERSARRSTLAAIASVIVFGAAMALWLAPAHMVPAELRGGDRATAITSARTAIVQFAAASFVFFGLYFTFDSVRVSRMSQAAQKANDYATRYAEAVKLASAEDSPSTRVGGILALETLAGESATERRHITRYLESALPNSLSGSLMQRTVYETVAVLGVLASLREEEQAELRLRGVMLEGIEGMSLVLPHADLAMSRIRHSRLLSSRLDGATLHESSWERVDFRYSSMRNCVAWGASFLDCDLSWCSLDGADFLCSDLRGVSLVGSRLENAVFAGSDLRGANLRSTDLRGCDLLDALLTGAFADAATKWPSSVNPHLNGVITR